jgi:regulator of protease activity HflC (stomatin/prohibitin superfamily)
VGAVGEVTRVSINDLRKNLRDLNEFMDHECRSTQARYGVELDASLITGIDPPPEVESALAAINTAHNQVSSDSILAQASADQKIEQSKRAVEIETLRAQAEMEPLKLLAEELAELHRAGPAVLESYLRNVRLRLYDKVKTASLEAIQLPRLQEFRSFDPAGLSLASAQTEKLAPRPVIETSYPVGALSHVGSIFLY